MFPSPNKYQTQTAPRNPLTEDPNNIWCGKCRDGTAWLQCPCNGQKPCLCHHGSKTFHCKDCMRNRLLSIQVPSGDERLDSFFREQHHVYPGDREAMRFMPYEDFQDIEFMAKGGFGSISSAAI